MENEKVFNWDAESFFRILTRANKLAQQHSFYYARVSGLQGFEEVLANSQKQKAFVCVQTEDDGFMTLNNSPHTRRVKTVFLAMRYPIDRLDLRSQCFSIMQEVFRQFMSVLLKEKTRLRENNIYLDERISFNEIEQYFAQGCACAYFSIATEVYTDLRFNSEEWTESVFSEEYNKAFY